MEIMKDVTMKRLNMVLEERRLESYEFWPYSDKDACNTKKLAEAGFFWTGTKDEPDAAECFICSKSLDGWESTDDPWEEHKKHAPQCLFVTFGKKEDELTLEQMFSLLQTMNKNLFEIAVNDRRKLFLKQVDFIREELKAYKKQRK